MRRKDLLGGLFFVGVGLLFTFYSRSVDIGTWEEPGPGFFPFWGGLLMLCLSGLLVVKNLFKAVLSADLFFPEKDSWKRVSATVLALIAFNLLLRPLGFILVTFLFVSFLVKFIFPQSWVRALVTAALATAATRIIFVNLLEINFPKGILGF